MNKTLKFCRDSIKHRIAARVVIEFLLCVAVLGSLGYAASHRIDMHLREALSRNVARQVTTVAYSVGQQFRQQIVEMEKGARLLEQDRIAPDALVEALDDNQFDTFTGLYDFENGLIAGYLPPWREYTALDEKLLRGETIIRYVPEHGLLFAVPIRNGAGEVTEAFIKLYGTVAMQDRFSLVSYGGEGLVVLFDKTGPLAVLSRGERDDERFEDFCDTAEREESYHQIWELVQRDGSGALVYKFNRKWYFHFGAKVPETDLCVMGNVPWKVVAGGIDSIYLAMLVVFCLLLTIIIVFARIAFVSRLRAKESEDLKAAKAMAESANKAKSEFLSNMSHEIRTPINAVLGMDEMILRESNEPPILEYAENIRTAGNSLLGLVNDILDFSKIEAGKMDIIPVEYSVSSLLNDLVNMIEKRAEKKGLKLNVEVAENLPSILFGDEIRLKQVVTNILTNAVKYTERGSVTLAVDYEKLAEDRIAVKISVKDTGIGIKEADIQKLFTAFERIEEARNRSIEGTGLGMNITQRLLNLMGSKLEVESVYGEGSDFFFTVEQKVMNWEPMGNFTESHRHNLVLRQSYQEKFTAPKAKILVVDDTVMNITVVKGLLKQTQVQITAVESGYECLHAVTKEVFDIIFLDHRMPGIDGIETLRRLKETPDNLNQNTPVIALTANAVSGAREEYMAAGFNDYLTKPINSVKLEEMMLKYLPADKVKRRSETAAAASNSPPAAEATEPETDLALPNWLRETSGLDVEAGVAYCGSVEAYLDALTVFAESIKSSSAEIEQYYQAADWENYTVKVHALKSSARVIGAKELSDKARRLEDAGNSGYYNEITENTPALLSLYREYSDRLSPLLVADSPAADTPKTPIEAAELSEAYETLKEIVASFDYDSLKFVMDSLGGYELPEAEQERYESIKKAAAKPDWEELRKILG
ncbi:MAG: response regulator [Selenomonadaceae bacterium]|nr:response regulator [Selenomonadaceae bacterium]